MRKTIHVLSAGLDADVDSTQRFVSFRQGASAIVVSYENWEVMRTAVDQAMENLKNEAS
jgi:hypothetical protein